MPVLESQRHVDQNEIALALELPDSFSSSDDRLGVTWGIGPSLETRDSGYLAKANADALTAYLNNDPSLAKEWEVIRASHWGCGWCEHIKFKVCEETEPHENRKPTRIFKLLLDWQDMLQEYGCADEQLVAEARREAIEEDLLWGHYGGLKDNLPDSWVQDMIDELERRNMIQDEPSGDIYISKESFAAVARSLDFLEIEDD